MRDVAIGEAAEGRDVEQAALGLELGRERDDLGHRTFGRAHVETGQHRTGLLDRTDRVDRARGRRDEQAERLGAGRIHVGVGMGLVTAGDVDEGDDRRIEIGVQIETYAERGIADRRPDGGEQRDVGAGDAVGEQRAVQRQIDRVPLAAG